MYDLNTKFSFIFTYHPENYSSALNKLQYVVYNIHTL